MQSSVLEPSSTRTQYAVQRQYPRRLLSVPITVYRSLPEGCVRTYGISLDISEGGMAAAICGPPQVGEAVDIELRLPKGDSVARAVVRYSNATQSGFQFLELPATLLQSIAAMAAEPTRRENVFVVK